MIKIQFPAKTPHPPEKKTFKLSDLLTDIFDENRNRIFDMFAILFSLYL